VAESIIVKIGANTADFDKAMDKIQDQTESLSDHLSQTAIAAGAAFAALSATAFVALKDFDDAQDASNRLTLAMQNQGVASKSLRDEYDRQAQSLMLKTGVDDDAITAAQATIQTMSGQIHITEGLTKAVLDLAAGKKMDLNATAELVARGINGHSKALKQLGIDIDDNQTKQQRLAQIIEKVSQAYGGQAETANRSSSGLKALGTAFQNLAEAIGQRFDPVVYAVSQSLTKFIDLVRQNKYVADLAASLLAAGLVVSGLALAVGVGGLAFLKLRAAMLAAKISTDAMTLGVRGLMGATGIGLLVILISEIYLNWSTIWPRMQAVFHAFAENIGQLAGGLGLLLAGVLFVSPDKIKQGLSMMKDALSKGWTEATKDLKPMELPVASQDNSKKAAAAAKAAAEQDFLDQMRLAKAKASNDLIGLEEQRASSVTVELKKQEIELLSKLEDEKYLNQRGALTKSLEDNRRLQEEQGQIEKSQRATLQNDLLAQNEEFQAMTAAQQEAFLQQNQAKLLGDIQTEKTIRTKAAMDKLHDQINANNQFLLNQKKFGTAYAEIDKLMHSEIYQGSSKAFGELSALTQSKNEELKAIGKAAALANIAMKTAESAMNIYAGFSTIPIIGPALGIVGAAAAVAFGAEQADQVLAAANGGLITGGVPGIDSVPVLAQQGELVAPTQNFDEVIGSVRAQREAQKMSGPADAGSGAPAGEAHLLLQLKGDLADIVETKIIQRQRLGISLLPKLGR
jgi:hypothetical protein